MRFRPENQLTAVCWWLSKSLLLCFICWSCYEVGYRGAVSTAAEENRDVLKVAYCLTGQLGRLEVISKIKNVFVPNAKLGHRISVFTLVDGNISDVRQTLYSYDYSTNPYARYSNNENALNDALISISKKYYKPSSSSSSASSFAASSNPIVYRTRYVSPPQRPYGVRGGKVPVADKFVNGAGMESAATRFQKNMRWMSSVRDCVKWVQQVEYQQRWFFDVVVRLRDDSYALNNWLLTPASRYRNGIVSVNFGQHHGINDHNFVVARRYADVLLRGMTEDYYFNDTLDEYTWLNPEHRIAKVAESLQIPVHMNTLCMQPLLPLRGPQTNTTFASTDSGDVSIIKTVRWRLHPAYVTMAQEQCSDASRDKLNQLVNELSKLGILVDRDNFKPGSGSNMNALNVLDASCCDQPWMQIIRDGFVPLEPRS